MFFLVPIHVLNLPQKRTDACICCSLTVLPSLSTKYFVVSNATSGCSLLVDTEEPRLIASARSAGSLYGSACVQSGSKQAERYQGMYFDQGYFRLVISALYCSCSTSHRVVDPACASCAWPLVGVNKLCYLFSLGNCLYMGPSLEGQHKRRDCGCMLLCRMFDAHNQGAHYSV